jgi:hypothetical protein
MVDCTLQTLSASEKRAVQAQIISLLSRHPGYIPVIVRHKESAKALKFVVNGETTLAQFMHSLRRRNSFGINSSTGLFMLIDGIVPTMTSTLSDIYAAHKSQDTLLLEIQVYSENVFGKSDKE